MEIIAKSVGTLPKTKQLYACVLISRWDMSLGFVRAKINQEGAKNLLLLQGGISFLATHFDSVSDKKCLSTAEKWNCTKPLSTIQCNKTLCRDQLVPILLIG